MKAKYLKDYPDILTVPEMCSMIGIGRATGYRLLQERRIAYFKLGKKIQIPKQSVLNYLTKLVGEEIS